MVWAKRLQCIKKVIKYAIVTSLAIALVMYLGVFLNADSIIEIFNRDNNLEIAQISNIGLKIYFLEFFLAGVNIIMATYLSATEHAKNASIIPFARGCIVIVPMVLLLSSIWNMIGIWLAFVLTECIVTMITIFIVGLNQKTLISKNIRSMTSESY